jgi:hypothetical protein
MGLLPRSGARKIYGVFQDETQGASHVSPYSELTLLTGQVTFALNFTHLSAVSLLGGEPGLQPVQKTDRRPGVLVAHPLVQGFEFRRDMFTSAGSSLGP